MRSILALAGFLAACFAVAGVGSWFTSMGMPNWYMSLEKPSWQPAAWVFGPVWSTLYVFMAVAAWLVWRRAGFGGATAALTLFFVQLGLNLAWSGIFFALQAPVLALGELVILWAAILATAVLFVRHSRWAALLMVPYLLWVTFAGALNTAIVFLN